MPGEAVRARVREAVAAGVSWVLLRDYGADPEAFAREAASFAEALRAIRPALVLSVVRRLDLARALGAGLHTSAGGFSIAEARKALGPVQPVGYSAHAPEEARDAAEQGADYALLSPIYPTRSHPERPALGPDAFGAAASGAFPVYALGGVTPARVPDVRAAGAYGVAVLSGILDAPDVAGAVGGYLRALEAPPITAVPA
jgi:thiamine-phosphate pyrophosphorylase